MRSKVEWFARWRRGGTAWHASAYARHANNDNKPTISVRITLDHDPNRNVFMLLSPEDAIQLGTQLIERANVSVTKVST